MMKTVITQDEAKLADSINEHHAQAEHHAREAVNHAMACGEALLTAKELVKHGEWLDWLKVNTTVSERTSRNYMRLASHRDQIEAKRKHVADLSVRGAIELLKKSKPKTPASVRLDDLPVEKRRQAVMGVEGGYLPYHMELRYGFCLMLQVDGMEVNEIAEYLGISILDVASALEFEPPREWILDRLERYDEMIKGGHQGAIAMSERREFEKEHEASGDYERDGLGWFHYTKEAGQRELDRDIASYKRWQSIKAHWFVSGLMRETRPVLAKKMNEKADEMFRRR